MSFLSSPRLSFAGRFLADVSTINNRDSANGGWNPLGGAAFEFLDCKVSGGWRSQPVANDDPVLSYAVAGRPDGSSAKMVDLDPEWQMSSELWALRVRVFDPLSGELAFLGRYEVASFRDLWQRQIEETLRPPGPPNQQPFGGRFVSTLHDLVWGPAAFRSELLKELHQISPERLSISFHQFGYFYTVEHARHRTGTLIGAIGPHEDGAPETALIARRLQQVPLPTGLTWLHSIDFEAVSDGAAIAMDLGHALPIANVDATLTSLGRWEALPQLKDCKSLALGVAQPDFVLWGKPSAAVELIGEVDPFVPDWYRETAGIVEFPLSEAARAVIERPLALYARLANGELISVTNEVVDALFVRADRFVFRMDPGERVEATIFARELGRPLANLTLYLNQQAGAASAALKVPEQVQTDSTGRARVTLEATDPGASRTSASPGLPPLDGHVYIWGYSPRPPNAGGAVREGTGLSANDVLAVHVRQHVDVPIAPNWDEDVQPILAGYAALYPIMSRHLFDIANYDQVVAHRAALRLAFNRDIDDPNYMPVTRDLSASKRAIIIKWLEAETGDPNTPLRRAATHRMAASVTAPTVTARTLSIGEPDAKRDNVGPSVAPVPSQTEERHDDQN